MVAMFNKRYVELVKGFTVIDVVYSANDALKILEKQTVDLLLLDIFMPGLNGLDLLGKIRAVGRGVDVIVITASCDKPTIMKTLRYGAIDYIIKPFEFERLEEALVSYRDLVQIMEKSDDIKQIDLDSYILNKDHSKELSLPKGIDRNTLKRVWETIKSFNNADFSTEELSILVGVSRVSTRKYLEFLKQIDVLKLALVYGTVGRPVYKYRCGEMGGAIIERYFAK